MQEPAVVSICGLTKRYPGVTALDSASLDFRAGEIHALMGENGAGKSTLIKLLTGVEMPDAGEVVLHGMKIQPTSPGHAARLGISAVYQEINLLPNLSVGENICLGRESRGAFGIRWRELHSRASRALAELGIEISTKRQLGSLSIAERQMVAIARALDISAQLLILDEPTSSLDRAEVVRLFEVLRALKVRGVCVLFVTHFIDQMVEISDRVTVLRNGAVVGSFDVAGLSKRDLVEAMIGKQWAAERTEKSAVLAKGGAIIVDVKHIGKRRSVSNVTSSLHAGEITGFAGLLGSGRTETIRLLFGFDRFDSGSFSVDGAAVSRMSPANAIRLGFGLCPEDRKHEGMFPNLSVKENISMALQIKQGWFRKISSRVQREIANEYIQKFSISTRSDETPIGQLSGGNQQKGILARWLAVSPRLLLLDEPTRGVDVGAKAEIERSLLELQANGMSMVFVASETEELVRLCGKVAVFRDKRMVVEISGSSVTEDRIFNEIAEPAE